MSYDPFKSQKSKVKSQKSKVKNLFVALLCGIFLQACADEKPVSKQQAAEVANEKMSKISMGDSSSLSAQFFKASNQVKLKMPMGLDLDASIKIIDLAGQPLHEGTIVLSTKEPDWIAVELNRANVHPKDLQVAVVEQSSEGEVLSRALPLFAKYAPSAQQDAAPETGNTENSAIPVDLSQTIMVVPGEEPDVATNNSPAAKTQTVINSEYPVGACNRKWYLIGERTGEDEGYTVFGGWNGYVTQRSYVKNDCGALKIIPYIRVASSMLYFSGSSGKEAVNSAVSDSSVSVTVSAAATLDTDICGRVGTNGFNLGNGRKYVFDHGVVGCNSAVGDALPILCIAGSAAYGYYSGEWVKAYLFARSYC